MDVRKKVNTYMNTFQIIVTILSSVLASSGAWSVILFVLQKRSERKEKADKTDTAERKMLLALAHDRIYYLCEKILADFQSGAIDHADVDEYDNLRILYDGYAALGGNGTCKRLFDAVSKLPIY